VPYKVVEKETRWGLNWALFKKYLEDVGTPEDYNKGLRFRRDHPEFFPRYIKGHVVKAVPRTPGILCFASKDAARRFWTYLRVKDRTTIIEVEGIGAGWGVSRLILGTGSHPWRLLDYAWWTEQVPYDTIGFAAVEVLE